MYLSAFESVCIDTCSSTNNCKFESTKTITMAAGHSYPSPQRKTGVLDNKFGFEESTPVIGREYSTLNIVDDILNAPNADDLIRDLAITS